MRSHCGRPGPGKPSGDEGLHLADGLVEAHEDGARDDRVADVELLDARDLGHGSDVKVREPVPRVDVESQLLREFRRGAELRELGLHVLGTYGLGVAAGGELDCLRAGGSRGLDLLALGIYEETHDDA